MVSSPVAFEFWSESGSEEGRHIKIQIPGFYSNPAEFAFLTNASSVFIYLFFSLTSFSFFKVVLGL